MDNLSPIQRSEMMTRIRSSNTAPERLLRKLVSAIRRGYRLNRKGVPGKPDIAFIQRQRAIFVHGCFWHGHRCRRGNVPRSNLDYWAPKIIGNHERDLRVRRRLRALGWRVLVVWECQITNKPEAVMQRLQRFLLAEP